MTPTAPLQINTADTVSKESQNDDAKIANNPDQDEVPDTAVHTDDSNYSTTFAPVRYWGSIGYEQRNETINSSEYMLQTFTTKLNASTFLWQPWIAQVNGGLGINTSTTDTMDGKGKSTFGTGNASLTLLPASRFPFEIHYDKNDNKLDTRPSGADPSYRTTRYGLSQRYRTLAGNTQYMVSYDRNIWESALLSADHQDLLHLDITHSLDKNTFQINGDTTNNERQQTNESSLINTVVIRHSYLPDSTLSVENLGNMSRTNYRLLQGESDFRYQQLSSSAFWHPTDQALTMTGSMRLYGLTSGPNSYSAPPAEINNASANLGAFYDLSKNTRLNGSLNINRNETNGDKTDASNQSAGIGYQSDEIALGTSGYSGFASGTVTNRINPFDNGQHYGLQLGHSLNRSTALDVGIMGLNLNQSVAADRDSFVPNTLRLTHGGSVTWSHVDGGSNTYLRLSASDTRAIDRTEYFFQLINLQISQNESLTRYSSLAGSLTMQGVRQQSSAAQITSPNIPNLTVTTYANTSADLSFYHQRAFGVPRLGFVSELRIYAEMPVQGLAVGPQQQDSRSWENRLDFPIGRLQLRLSARVSEIRYSNTIQTLLLFSINRLIGDIY